MKTALPKITETEFQTQVIRLAQLFGWKVAHFRAVKIQRKDGSVYFQTPVQADGAGFPDLILLRNAVMIAAELKVGRNQPTPAQEAWLRDFAKAGAIAVTWTPKDWKLIERMLSRT